MTKWSNPVPPALAVLAACLAAAGCSPSTTAPAPPPVSFSTLGPGSNLKSIMREIGARGPNALWPKINSELNTDSPPWDDLKPQSERFSMLAANVGSFPQTKGQETWDKDAKDFANLAAALHDAVVAKDKDKAKETQKKVNDACDACHQAHRAPRPGG